MRRTRKWVFVAQEAKRLADLGLTPIDIAKRVEVKRSTVQRWMAAGKLTDTRHGARRPTVPTVPITDRSPSEWATAVRESYALDATDEQLVTMAESVLAIALSPTESIVVRLSAMGRFQAIVKQLALVAKTADVVKSTIDPPTPPKRAPQLRVIRRPNSDPRRALMAVSK